MILVTGAAGFIGFHVSRRLLELGENVIAVDSVNSYYDPALKEARLRLLTGNPRFTFRRLDICDFGGLEAIFDEFAPTRVCHLAAQAGVRYSLIDPFAYQKSNNEGFLNILELSRRRSVGNLVYASSSSVYGANSKLPFSEGDRTDCPVSLYAATKRSNELVAHSYSHLFGLPTSGLRFFTVYGPFGRPDMALFLFTKAILAGEPIDVYNEGRMIRNFTYIDDIVQGVLLVLDHPAQCEIYNIGNDRAEQLLDFIREIERCTGKRAVMHFLPLQPGDVPATRADIAKIGKLGYVPTTDIAEGVERFVTWYRGYYNI